MSKDILTEDEKRKLRALSLSNERQDAVFKQVVDEYLQKCQDFLHERIRENYEAGMNFQAEMSSDVVDFIQEVLNASFEVPAHETGLSAGVLKYEVIRGAIRFADIYFSLLLKERLRRIG